MVILSVTRLIVHRALPLAPLGACIAVRSEHCVNAAAKSRLLETLTRSVTLAWLTPNDTYRMASVARSRHSAGSVH